MTDIRDRLIEDDTELSDEALDEIDQLSAAVHYFKLKLEKFEEVKALLHEAVDKYPVEEKQDLWTSRVRKWLRENERPEQN